MSLHNDLTLRIDAGTADSGSVTTANVHSHVCACLFACVAEYYSLSEPEILDVAFCASQNSEDMSLKLWCHDYYLSPIRLCVVAHAPFA